METISNVTEIDETIFNCLDQESVASMRIVNHANKRILDNPRFWIRKFSRKYHLEIYYKNKIGENIASWTELLNQSNYDPKLNQEMTMILMKMYYMNNGVESPMKLALQLVEGSVIYSQILKKYSEKEVPIQPEKFSELKIDTFSMNRAKLRAYFWIYEISELQNRYWFIQVDMNIPKWKQIIQYLDHDPNLVQEIILILENIYKKIPGPNVPSPMAVATEDEHSKAFKELCFKVFAKNPLASKKILIGNEESDFDLIRFIFQHAKPDPSCHSKAFRKFRKNVLSHGVTSVLQSRTHKGLCGPSCKHSFFFN